MQPHNRTEVNRNPKTIPKRADDVQNHPGVSGAQQSGPTEDVQQTSRAIELNVTASTSSYRSDLLPHSPVRSPTILENFFGNSKENNKTKFSESFNNTDNPKVIIEFVNQTPGHEDFILRQQTPTTNVIQNKSKKRNLPLNDTNDDFAIPSTSGTQVLPRKRQNKASSRHDTNDSVQANVHQRKNMLSHSEGPPTVESNSQRMETQNQRTENEAPQNNQPINNRKRRKVRRLCTKLRGQFKHTPVNQTRGLTVSRCPIFQSDTDSSSCSSRTATPTRKRPKSPSTEMLKNNVIDDCVVPSSVSEQENLALKRQDLDITASQGKRTVKSRSQRKPEPNYELNSKNLDLDVLKQQTMDSGVSSSTETRNREERVRANVRYLFEMMRTTDIEDRPANYRSQEVPNRRPRRRRPLTSAEKRNIVLGIKPPGPSDDCVVPFSDKPKEETSGEDSDLEIMQQNYMADALSSANLRRNRTESNRNMRRRRKSKKSKRISEEDLNQEVPTINSNETLAADKKPDYEHRFQKRLKLQHQTPTNPFENGDRLLTVFPPCTPSVTGRTFALDMSSAWRFVVTCMNEHYEEETPPQNNESPAPAQTLRIKRRHSRHRSTTNN